VHTPIASFEKDRLRTQETVQRYREAVLDEKLFEPVVDSLETALSNLIEDGTMRRRMGEAAYKEVEQGKFSVAQRNRHLLEYYSEALQ
jgi:glycosyltransferase involved in cell wall biosynthesis